MSPYIVEIAPDSDFTYHNIPFGVFSSETHSKSKRICSAIGDFVIDLNELCEYFEDPELQNVKHVYKSEVLNDFMALNRAIWKKTRDQIQKLLLKGSAIDNEHLSKVLVPIADVVMHLPAQIGDYTGKFQAKGFLFQLKKNTN